MTTLAKIMSRNELFVRGKELVERLANELQRYKVPYPALGKDFNLDLNREDIPGGRRGHYVYSVESKQLETLAIYHTQNPPTGSKPEKNIGHTLTLTIPTERHCA